MLRKKGLILFGTLPALLLAASPSLLRADDAPLSNGKFITVEEYEKYKKEMNAKLDSVLTELKKAKETQATSDADRDAQLDEIAKQVKDNKHDILSAMPGTSNFIIVGDGSVGFTSQHPSPSTSFSAGISPMVLWKLNQDILVEAAADIGVDNATADGSGETTFDLKIADISYFLCDYTTVGGGLFVVPFGRYHNHFDPGWITKLPDDPLVFSDSSIDPGSELGAFIKGAIPISETKVTYDLYVTNGPILITQDPNAAGSLRHDNWDSSGNSNKAVGGRVGFIPIPSIEVGYSLMFAQVDPTVYPTGFSSSNGVFSLSQAVDFEFRRDFEAIAGTIDFNVEEAWQHVGTATYTGDVDPTFGLPSFGPSTFDSDRQGGYAQLAYRPSLMNGPLRKVEGVLRYDWLVSPLSVPGGEDERRWTIGLDYWILPNVVAKAAYEFDRKAVADSNDVFMLQLAAGF